MATQNLSEYEPLYSTIIIVIIAVLVIMAYKRTSKDYSNYNFALIGLFMVLLAMLFMPVQFLWFLFLLFFIIVFNLIANFFVQKSFTDVEESLVIDKKEQVWDIIKNPPELKQESLEKITQIKKQGEGGK